MRANEFAQRLLDRKIMKLADALKVFRLKKESDKLKQLNTWMKKIKRSK